ncbi:MAG: DUF3800 domain-containing protein [Melioribacteraceae bacterium]|nr:DUF3800 domain-containing protein [Melioribacteraceae bacterium]MCF8262945.1 DUF3800 domain-containing protein [Melioribacteraceae bacterium]
MIYYLFIDESGDHGLINIDSSFPVFVLAGVLISESQYVVLVESFQRLKKNFWDDKKVILHSRDIRKCEKEFSVLFDLEFKKQFYGQLNRIIKDHNYSIISSAILKENYVSKYGKLLDDVYEISLSFLIERSIFFLDDLEKKSNKLNIIIERRGKKEDAKLKSHFINLIQRGTGFVSDIRIKSYSTTVNFKRKDEDIAGLQLADLIAYPIARYVLDSKRANPAFDILSEKFYSKNHKRYGLKVFP